MGKLLKKDLQKLLACIKCDQRVVIPPKPGYDSGVHRMGDQYVVISTDPCLGVPLEWFGWLLIHYPSSDAALFGAKPEFGSITLLGPPSTDPQLFQTIMKQACEAADELDLLIITGHTGTYEGVSTVIGVCTVYGTVAKAQLITPDGAKPGDHILCTKPVGLEIAINFALTRRPVANRLFGTRRTRDLMQLVQMQSCVKEALALAEIPGVHALHDATEGGVLTALNEMAEAANLGCTIHFDHVPIVDEAAVFQQHFTLSDAEVLAMSSTGTILASVAPEAKTRVEKVMRSISLPWNYIGTFTSAKQRTLIVGDTKTPFPSKALDPYTQILTGSI
jgi:hydrogenase maturation factor